MSIVETMARAIREADRLATTPGSEPAMPFEHWHPTVQEAWCKRARAALRAIKPEDVSDGMVEAMAREAWGTLMRDGKPVPHDIKPESVAIFRRAIAAAIAAGAEQ